MIEIKDLLKNTIKDILNTKFDLDNDIKTEEIVVEVPPNSEMGDFAFPMFSYARVVKKSPQIIAQSVKEELDKKLDELSLKEILIAGPYLNIKLNRSKQIKNILDKIFSEDDSYGKSNVLNNTKTMIEFSCPNTNKPLHLGHLRNDSIGESVSKIYKENGAEVQKVNLINDRGIHICKSMLAYKKFANGTTPEKENIKSDHFVGDYYVKYDKWSKEDDTADEQARKMLVDWENGDPETVELWKTMNKWTIDGIQETYEKTGISFDDIYYESKTYMKGKDEVLKGLKDGVFYKEDDGSIWIDLSDIKLDKKVLLRGDGTSLYLTQDIGTAIARHKDWPFEKLIYVVASEQKYHFQVLFHVLKKLGFKWAENLFHLSYGMVNLPEGKMKSREGTVVDADDLFDELKNMAKNEIIAKGRDSEINDIDKTSEDIALGALNYYLLQTNPVKDMIFDPKESISFNGNTGPYLQYMGARITSILVKYENMKDDLDSVEFNADSLIVEDEWDLVKIMERYPEVVKQSALEYNPSLLCSYVYDLAKIFSRYYHDNPILHNDSKETIVARVDLSKAVLVVMKNAFKLIGIPYLEKM